MVYYLQNSVGHKSCLVTRLTIFKLVALVFLLTNCLELEAQGTNLYVLQKDNSQTTYDLSNIAKLTFENENLIVKEKSGNDLSFSLQTIRNLMFNELISVDDNINHTIQHFKLYPNPSDGFINIENIPIHTTKVELFDTEGKLVMTKNLILMSNNIKVKINISDLVQGVYVCRIIAEGTVYSQNFIKK